MVSENTPGILLNPLLLITPDTICVWPSLRASLYAGIRASPVWFRGKLGTYSATPKHTVLFNNYAYMWLRTSFASKDLTSIEKWQVSCQLPIFLGKLPCVSFPLPKQTTQLKDQDRPRPRPNPLFLNVSSIFYPEREEVFHTHSLSYWFISWYEQQS